MAERREPDGTDPFAAEREALLREIVGQIEKYGTGDGDWALDPKVLAALDKVPREKFVPMMERASAYANKPLPIGHRQTISQPLIVALMTHHLRVRPSSKVLEIGTGSGYQTAVLAELAKRVVTIENVAPLARAAKTTLDGLGYKNIRFIEGDGRRGAPDDAPFDRILVAAAGATLPEDLVAQLGADGRLVAPVGACGEQQLVLVTRSADGQISKRTLFPVAFVPLTYGDDRSDA